MRTRLEKRARASRQRKSRAVACPTLAPPMTRCECTGVDFIEIGKFLEAGEPLPSVLARTGCSDMCTACLPDLDSYLANRSRPR